MVTGGYICSIIDMRTNAQSRPPPWICGPFSARAGSPEGVEIFEGKARSLLCTELDRCITTAGRDPVSHV
jgi:hypothetical protein